MNLHDLFRQAAGLAKVIGTLGIVVARAPGPRAPQRVPQPEAVPEIDEVAIDGGEPMFREKFAREVVRLWIAGDEKHYQIHAFFRPTDAGPPPADAEVAQQALLLAAAQWGKVTGALVVAVAGRVADRFDVSAPLVLSAIITQFNQTLLAHAELLRRQAEEIPS